MRAFVIDPFTNSINEVEYSGDYTEIYSLGDFDCFALATFNEENDGIFVDDEGLFKDNQRMFMVNGYPQPLAGKGVVLGCDEEGASVEPTVSLEWLQDNVMFQPL